jgi:hypothetical protein
MANYRVLYLKQANLGDTRFAENRDVQEYTVQVERDGVFEAEWIGTIDSPTLFSLANTDVLRFHRNAVVVIAEHVEAAVARGTHLADTPWVPLTLAEVVNSESGSDCDWTAGDVVLEFDA